MPEFSLLAAADQLASKLSRLRFKPPVAYVYNPLIYARASYARYVELYGKGPKEVVLFGMNPGPFGMAQTGVPFGEVSSVRDWLGIEAPVGKPPREHPKRPVTGFACHRAEVSGQRVWGWAQRRFGTPKRFFDRFFIANYCPLLFLEASGRNLPLDKLARDEQRLLTAICDHTLRAVVQHLAPQCVFGIGRFAEQRARIALADLDVRVGFIPHPSPASPAANQGWERLAEEAVVNCGVKL